MSIQTQLEQFKALPYDEKLKIAMNIIVNLKDKGNVQAQEIYEYISTLEKVPENILESIYEDYEISVEEIKKKRITTQLHVFDNAQTSIDQIRAREAQERAQENPDNILKQI